MKQTPTMRPRAVLVSAGIACVAWLALIAKAWQTIGDDAYGARVVAIGFPVVYCGWVGMLWLVAGAAANMDRSLVAGPAKDFQMWLSRGPMVWFCNAGIVFLPAAALVVALLGVFGALPPR